MPDVSAEMDVILRLYARCMTFRCLPYPGGLLDQPEWIMDLFDSIEAAKLKVRRDQADEARREAERTRLRNG